MKVDDPQVFEAIRNSMVVRIATLSRSGRPSVTPLYFIAEQGHLWLGTSSWTLAARDASADPRVTLLFASENKPLKGHTLRITGRAVVTTGAHVNRTYVWRVAFKYSLMPRGLWNMVQHLQQYRLMDRYHKQSSAKGMPCIIDVTPEGADLLPDMLSF